MRFGGCCLVRSSLEGSEPSLIQGNKTSEMIRNACFSWSMFLAQRICMQFRVLICWFFQGLRLESRIPSLPKNPPTAGEVLCLSQLQNLLHLF